MFNVANFRRNVSRVNLPAARRAVIAVTWLFLLAIINGGLAFAQNVQYTKGATDSALRSDLQVDPSTLGMSIQVPLGEYPGRGVSLPINLRYASKVWRASFLDTYATSFVKTRVEGKFAEGSVAGWTASLDIPWLESGGGHNGPYDEYGNPICISAQCVQTPGAPFFYVNRMLLHMPDGSSHEMRRDDILASGGSSAAGVYVAVDGSQIRYDTTTWTLYLPDGSRYLLNVSGGAQAQYIDRNGNTLTYTYSSRQWTDTLGRVIKVALSNSSSGDAPVRLPGVGDPAGSDPTTYSLAYTLRWKNLHELIAPYTFPGGVRVIGDRDKFFNTNNPQLHTVPSLFTSYPSSGAIFDYLVSLGPPYGSDPAFYHDPVVLQQIILPNGRAYTFDYNVFGEISKVTYPTGGYEEFEYSSIPGLNSSLATFIYDQANRGVTKRRVSVKGDGSDVVEWNYSIPVTGKYTARVTSPNGSYAERDLHIGKGSDFVYFGFDDARAGRAYDERAYSATGQLLRRKLTKWEVSGPSPAGQSTATRNARVTKAITLLLDTGGNALAQTTAMAYDADLNVIQTQQYDYTSVSQATATSSPANNQPTTVHAFIDSFPIGTPLRTEETTYLVNDPDYVSVAANYRARNLIALPTKAYVKNGSGTVVAATKLSYDEAAYAPLSNSTTAVQWSDPGATRGTATTIQRWLNIHTDPASGVTTTYTWPSGQWLIAHTQTDVCGNVRKTWDARGKMSEIKYDGNFSDGNNHNAYAYPTQMLTPPPYTGGAGGLGIPFGTNQQLTTSAVYDFWTGKAVSSTDANMQMSTLSYANDSLQRLTKVTRPAGGGETIFEYNDTPGACACDRWIKTRTLQSAGVYVEDYVFIDSAGRTWRVAHGEGGGKWSVTDTQYDNLGRAWKVANPALTGALGGAPTLSSFALVTANVTTTTYDDLNRVLTVTTPDGSVGTTNYSGNQVTVADQANGTPNPINANQPRNTTRRSVTDALGRLTQVVEAPGSMSYTTNYTYDALGNLRQVNQGGQNRYFLYDSVGRLVRARNLEQDVNAAYNLTDPVTGAGNNQWTLKYAYDENGNLKKRWDARGVAASYNYDDINRNYNIGYSGGTVGTPSVERYYDGATRGKGRPWSTVSYHAHPTTGQAAYQFRQVTTYDENGRPTQGNQQFLNSSSQWVIYTMSRSYDLMGHVTGQNYPSGRAANYSYTAAGRLSSFSGNLGDGVPRTYADQMAYNAAGQMTSERFGTQTQLYHTMNYNLRLQMYANMLGTSVAWWNRGLLSTYYSVQARSIGAPGADYSGNNGNVWMQEHYVPTNDAITTHTVFRDIYEYDDLNRLKQDTGVQKDVANNWTTPHQQAFNFDQWGNRTINAGATFGANINNLAFTASTATNRLDKPGGSTCTGSKNGMCYDQAGNLIFDNYSFSQVIPPIPGGDREYDGENRMTKGWGTGGWNYYVYDGDGERVRRVVWVSGFLVEYWQVYDFDGELIAEYLANGAAGTTNNEYGYRGGQLLLVGGCDVARWMVSDQLGTPRIEVDVTGSLANVRRHDYLPFGEELTAGMGNGSARSGPMGYALDCVRQKFGSKERDNETGLDYFGARYLSNTQGRFTSPDEPFADQNEYEPQSWNLYTYVVNNPLKYIDPFGRWKEYVDKESGEIFYIADKEGDTLSGLAKLLGISTSSVVKFFDGVTDVELGGYYNVTGLVKQSSSQLSSQSPSVGFLAPLPNDVGLRPTIPPSAIPIAARILMAPLAVVGVLMALETEMGKHDTLDYIPPPKELKAFPNAKRVKTKGGRARWEDDDYIYEWDSQHGKVEKYNKRGKHLGEFDPDTGHRTKPADPKRYIDP